MSQNDLVKKWLEKANEDFGFSNSYLEDMEAGYHPQICFHFQQSAEKYLKAYIVANKLEFRKIHDLPALLKICEKHDKTLNCLFEACEFLTDFYVDTRYPVQWPAEISRKEAERARDSAAMIRNTISQKT